MKIQQLIFILAMFGTLNLQGTEQDDTMVYCTLQHHENGNTVEKHFVSRGDPDRGGRIHFKDNFELNGIQGEVFATVTNRTSELNRKLTFGLTYYPSGLNYTTRVEASSSLSGLIWIRNPRLSKNKVSMINLSCVVPQALREVYN